MSRSDKAAEAPPIPYQVSGIFRERLPASALRQHVDRVWTNELHGPAELEIVPDGCIDLYWTGDRLQIAGPNTQVITARMASAANLVGVRFWPGVAGRWLGVSAVDLLNTHPPLDDLWGRRPTDQLSDKLADAKDATAAATILEHALIDHLPQVAPADPVVSATVAAAAKEGPSTNAIVRGLIDQFGWSERTLRRRCVEAFGYGPKTLQRILRFQRFLRLLSNRHARLSALAIEAGYADQAHLTREVRRLSGQSPSTLMSELQSAILIGRFDQDTMRLFPAASAAAQEIDHEGQDHRTEHWGR
jgi:AraC-like DNA-binding protein